jgi:hypothetical protein
MRRLVLSATVLAVASVAIADTPKGPSPSPRPTSGRAAENGSRPKAQPTAAASPAPSPAATKAGTEKAGTEKKVYTNQDLPAEPSPAVIPSPGPTGAGRGTVNVLPESANLPTVSRDESDLLRTEASWREKVRQRRADLDNAEGHVRDLEDRIAELRNDRGATNVMDPNREQSRQAQIAEAQAELERTKADIERFRQALADLEEEARRAGVPPGWLREQ